MAVVVRKWKMRICGVWMVIWAYTGSWASVRCRGDDVMSAVRLLRAMAQTVHPGLATCVRCPVPREPSQFSELNHRCDTPWSWLRV
jgi:hypothetical protein